MAQDVEAGTRAGIATFADRLAEEVDRKRSQLLVGLDPRPELLPVELRGDVHVSRAAAADVVAIVSGALQAGFLPAAPRAEACRWCDYRPVCGPWEEQRTKGKPADKLRELLRLRERP